MKQRYGKAQITKEIKESGIKITRVKNEKDAKNIGIHLLVPDQRELEEAVFVAVRDLFPAIYIHGFNTWGYQYGFSKEWSK